MKKLLQGQHRHTTAAAQNGRPRTHVADYVQHHAVISGVIAMAVGVPVPLADVDFHVSPDQAHSLLLKYGVPEIGPGSGAHPAGIKHPEASAIAGSEVLLPGGLLSPQLHQETFRYLRKP
ncbi:MAG: hypothetical protein J4F46_09985 [Dehalococcoidia bacterium]|nr:hypothetical protein [Dehalococcoidia bacterium]